MNEFLDNNRMIDLDKFLPFGEMLLEFVKQPLVSEGEIAILLKQRGVFINPSDKQHTVPWMRCILLSADEFDQLLECQRGREDKPKVNTQTIPWQSESTLDDAYPEYFDINKVLDLSFANFRIANISFPQRIDNNPNHLRIEYTIERKDFSKNWASTQNFYSGELELQITEDRRLVLKNYYTSDETKYVGLKTSQGLVKSFKDAEHIEKSDKVTKILLEHFSNRSRFEFFMQLTRNIKDKNKNEILAFDDILHIGVSPDKGTDMPDKIKWMGTKAELDIIDLKGQSVHETDFIASEKYHDFLILYNMEVRYRFDYQGLQGSCVVSLEFSKPSKKIRNKEAELAIKISHVSFDASTDAITKRDLEKIVLSEIEKVKLECYSEHVISPPNE